MSRSVKIFSYHILLGFLASLVIALVASLTGNNPWYFFVSFMALALIWSFWRWLVLINCEFIIDQEQFLYRSGIIIKDSVAFNRPTAVNINSQTNPILDLFDLAWLVVVINSPLEFSTNKSSTNIASGRQLGAIYSKSEVEKLKDLLVLKK